MAKKKTGKRQRPASTPEPPLPAPAELAAEAAAADAYGGLRSPYESQEIAAALDPVRLAGLVREAKQGNARELMILAEEMEERDPHYRSVLSTRKLSIVGLDPVVEPASDAARDQELAAAVRRDVVQRPQFAQLIGDALDALGKGYSAVEIVWDTARVPWRPAAYHYRHPSWFQYDRRTGAELRLFDGGEGTALPPYKFIVHQPQLKSGLAVRGGLALAAAYVALIKSVDVAAWAAFMQVFGHPLRVGKFPKNATEQDFAVLKRAVRNMGRDLGVVIPDTMVIDVVDAVKPGSSTEHFRALAEWCDGQLSKLVLGQTATTEGTPGRLGADTAQEDVRLDIKEADADQLETTLNRDLVVPYVTLNWGAQEAYPVVRLPVPRAEDVNSLIENAAKMIDRGLPVKRSEIYAKLGLTEPEEGDAVIEPPAPPPGPAGPAHALQRYVTAAMNAAGSVPPPRRNDVEADLAELIEERDWEPIMGPLHDAVREWADRMESPEEAQRRLPELLAMLNGERFVEELAADLLRARGLGDLHFSDRTG